MGTGRRAPAEISAWRCSGGYGNSWKPGRFVAASLGKTGRRAMIKPGGSYRRSRNSRAILISARVIRGSRLSCYDAPRISSKPFTTEGTEVEEFKIPDLVPLSAGLRGRVRGLRQLAPVP